MRIPKWKKALSYTYPINILTRKTEFQTLEVNPYNGQLFLDSKDANYSFGSLHYVFQEALSKIRIPLQIEQHILIAGFGAGSIAQIVKDEYQSKAVIQGIELDPVVLELGRTYFDYGQWDNCQIHVGKAETIIPDLNQQFDLLIIDLFIEQIIPSACTSLAFFKALLEKLAPKATLLMNTMNLTNSSALIKNWKETFEHYGNVSVMQITEENKVLAFQKN